MITYEYNPVKESPATGVCEVCSPENATFWTVYERREGIAFAMIDCVDEHSAKMAVVLLTKDLIEKAAFTRVERFKDIKVGEYFMFNQNKYLKRSSRTALLLEFNRIFYFSPDDVCKV